MLTLAALAASAASPAERAGAAAPPAPTRGLSDGGLFASADARARAAAIAVAQEAGARFARFPIAWSTVVANETFTRPDERTSLLSDPAHPAYRWARIDAAVHDLAAAGLTPITYFMAAPPWAQSAPRYPYAAGGTWAPRPADLAAFASAVARRYDGTYPDPLRPGRALPRISHFQTWNEPNLARYLQPQWVGTSAGDPVLFSARWYRRMHLAAYTAIHRRQPAAEVGLAGLAPTGDAIDGTARVSPMRFLRALLCVGAPRTTCPERLPFEAIALHPLSTSDPDRPAQRPDDIAVADLQPKLAALLGQARREGRLRLGPVPALWITELNWTAGPGGGIKASQQAAVIGRAMLRLRQAGAALVDWQFATDPSAGRTGDSTRAAGLTTAGADGLPGSAKPFLAGFAFPVAAVRAGAGRAYVWAQLPAGPAAPAAVIERQVGGRWRAIARRPVHRGVVDGLVAVPEGARVRVRAGRRVSPVVSAQYRLGVISTANAAARLAIPGGGRDGDDLRPTDPDGPGALPDLPPLMPGGAPPASSGLPVLPIPGPVRPARRLTFTGTGAGDVILGTSGADRLAGGGGDDLLIGLGGDDRFDAGPGRDLVVRGRRPAAAR